MIVDIKHFPFYLLILTLLLACGKAGVDPITDPTNEDAVYNIIRFDSPSAFNLDLFDLSVPDTTLALSASLRPLHWWRNIQHDSLDIDIRIHYPDQTDTIGTVPSANVTVVKYFWGTLEVIALDTTNGGSQRVRLSKSFNMKGTIIAIFDKYGFDYNTRRGWRLTQLSDAVFTPQGAGQTLPLPTVSIQTPDSLIHVNSSIKLLRYLPLFAPSESVSVNINMIDSTNIVRIRYPNAGGYGTREILSSGSGNYIGGFTFPRLEAYGHFLVDAIPASALTDTLRYRPNALGVIYRVH